MTLRIATRHTTLVRVTICGIPLAIDSAQEITVARRFLGPRKGFTVRLMQAGAIICEWKAKTQTEQEARYMDVMRDLAAGEGFMGIVGTSNDHKTITGDAIDWDALDAEGAAA